MLICASRASVEEYLNGIVLDLPMDLQSHCLLTMPEAVEDSDAAMHQRRFVALHVPLCVS